MITVGNIKVNVDSSSLEIDVSAPVGETITKVLIWDETTFQDYAEAIDVSSLLVGGSPDELLSVPAATLGKTLLTGLYFIEITDSTLDDCCNVFLAVTANLTNIHACILDKVLSLEVKNCKLVTSLSGDCCKGPDICVVDAMLEGLYTALLLCDFLNAIQLYNNLKEICQDCFCNCPELTANVSGVYTKHNDIDPCGTNEVLRY